MIGVIFLWFINSYTSLRYKIRLFRDELNDTVDSFYIEKEYLKRPHKIYDLLITVINKNIKSDLIEDIFCFSLNENTKKSLSLVNGSRFIWEYKLDGNELIKKIEQKKDLHNQEITIEKEFKGNNIVIYSKVEEHEYFFFITTSNPIPFYYLIIGTFRTLQPAFIKISNVLVAEKKIQELKSEEISKLSKRSQYVNRANKTMHFMRNRLGPFSNLITQLDGFEKVTEDKRKQFKTLIFKEKDRAKVELKNITARANDMLEKSTNPFAYNKTTQISIERIFTIFKRNVSIFFPDISINISVEFMEKKRFVNINEEGFEMFLSDWLNNIYKYKINRVYFDFIFNEELLTINFKNDHKLTNVDINKMITDLTSNDRNEIMKRTTHGLFLIKSTLEEMNIKFEVNHNETERLLLLQLKLKTT